MKYIKYFEKKIKLTPEQKELRKIANKLKFNLNKFFENKYLDKNYSIHVKATYFIDILNNNKKTQFYVGFSGVVSEWESTKQFNILIDKIKNMNINPYPNGSFVNIRLTKKETEDLIYSLKNELPLKMIEIEIDKYNL